MDECKACGAELHVCLACKHYDEKLISKCRHDHADPPEQKHRTNFCDYFRPNPHAYKEEEDDTASDAAQEELASLFGEEAPEEQKTDAASELNQLFGTEAAERKAEQDDPDDELKALFGDEAGEADEEPPAEDPQSQWDALFGKQQDEDPENSNKK
ncbi:MAG: hypothetical protein MJA83_06200 [Gammaproteobacteria bacterium]|nr:hypothetical protein [Gammaproteobacteria bacterium]